MSAGAKILIVGFSFAMIVVSFLIGIWAKKKADTAQAFFGGTALFGPFTVGLSTMSAVASAFAIVGIPGIIYATGNPMSFWMLSVTFGNLWVLMTNAAVRNETATRLIASTGLGETAFLMFFFAAFAFVAAACFALYTRRYPLQDHYRSA